MMSQQSKRELLEVLRPGYLKASKAEKQRMMDEFTVVTGYYRKYAIRVLKHPAPRIRRKRVGQGYFLYEALRYPCGARVPTPLNQLIPINSRACFTYARNSSPRSFLPHFVCYQVLVQHIIHQEADRRPPHNS